MKNRYLKWIPCALLLASLAHAKGQPYVVTNIDVVQLGTLGGAESVALDINDWGQIVGWAMNVNGVRRAFLYRPDGSMQDITFDGIAIGGMSVGEADGINNHAQVVGTVKASETAIPHAFYFDPSGASAVLDEFESIGCYN